MRIAIYSPYLDTASGGEKYILTIAEVLSKKESVDLLLDNHLIEIGTQNIIQKLNKLHKIDLSKVSFIKAPIGRGSNFFLRLWFLKKYDVVIYLTDGSIFYSTAKKNLIHFQVPFKNINTSWWGNLKLSTWDAAIYNSQFTKQNVEQEWKIHGQVIYPPVDVVNIKPLKKKSYILSVGRFTSFLKFKKHEEMIAAFTELFKTGKISDWSLHLAGSVEGDKNYINELKQQVGDLPIFFHFNIDYEELITLYGESSIYWHFAGLNETDPAKMEHFGITTVESMAGGCVPIVINKGGQQEIITDEVDGFLWDNILELKKITLQVINNTNLREQISIAAQQKAQVFSKQSFVKTIDTLIYGN